MTVRSAAGRFIRTSLPLRRLVTRWTPWQAWSSPSTSQNGEDLLVKAVLPEASGTYVDVGANHPIKFNNTWSLYRRGWSGTLIDPLEESAALCRARRPRDRFLTVAIGKTQGSATLHTFDFDMPSTLSTKMADAASSWGVAGQKDRSVEVVPLSSLGFTASPEDPTLLDVDVEDLDLEVLESNDFSTFRPRVIIVEERRQPIEEATPISRLLTKEGYVLLAVTIFNSIYVHRQWLEHNPGFRGYFPSED